MQEITDTRKGFGLEKVCGEAICAAKKNEGPMIASHRSFLYVPVCNIAIHSFPMLRYKYIISYQYAQSQSENKSVHRESIWRNLLRGDNALCESIVHFDSYTVTAFDSRRGVEGAGTAMNFCALTPFFRFDHFK